MLAYGRASCHSEVSGDYRIVLLTFLKYIIIRDNKPSIESFGQGLLQLVFKLIFHIGTINILQDFSTSCSFTF